MADISSGVDAPGMIKDFFQQYKPLHIKEGEVLLQPGDEISHVYYLEEGHVRQYVISSEGAELTHHLYKPGSFFPLLLSLNNVENRFYIEAFTAVTLRPAPMTEVLPFLKQHPDLLIDLNHRLLAGLDGLLHRIEVMTFGSASTRVANSLLFMARHFGKEQGDELAITQPFTHKNLSHIAGLTRETTSLELEKLVQRNVIGRENNSYIIHNIAKLQQLAEF